MNGGELHDDATLLLDGLGGLVPAAVAHEVVEDAAVTVLDNTLETHGEGGGAAGMMGPAATLGSFVGGGDILTSSAAHGIDTASASLPTPVALRGESELPEGASVWDKTD